MVATGERELQLRDLEASFQARLREELQACAAGQWGVFGQYDGFDLGVHRLPGVQAGRELLALASEIEKVRTDLGYAEPFGLVERFKFYRAMRGANVPGESNLALRFLSEMDGE